MTSPMTTGLTPGFLSCETSHYMVQKAQDLTNLSIFFVQFWLVSLIFQMTVVQGALKCISAHSHPGLRVHENHVLTW